jgi:hypothetical protein
MLVAEVHGKYVLEARNFEDYLTSTVFGHLRYVKPCVFWEALFDLAVSQASGSGVITVSERIRQDTGCALASFATLRAIFWPEHKEGIPDLILHFAGNHARSVVILIEAKLTAKKSGNGDWDQLARYLRILDSLSDLHPRLPSDAFTLAVYLTATDSRSEIIESLEEYGDTEQARLRLFHLQWQDVIRAIEFTTPTSELEALILDDVERFLRTRGLEYFSGMEDASTIPTVNEADGDFLKDEPLFDLESIPTGLDIIDERWMHAH